jgi:hypothetical protein
VCEDLVLLGGRGDAPGGGPTPEYDRPVSMPRSAQRQQAPPAEDPSFNQGVTDDDVPF